MKKITKATIIASSLLIASASLASNHQSTNHKKTENGRTPLTKTIKTIEAAVVNLAVSGELPPLPPEYSRPGMPSPHTPPDQDPRSNNPRPIIPGQTLPPEFKSLGSGVIIDAKKGYIITNAHVVRNAKTITVTLNTGRRLRARKVGADRLSDVAVLQVQSPYLKQVELADSDKINVGEQVYAIGNPYGLGHTLTSGVISALHRSEIALPGKQYEDFIQTDAAINPGNSGGALVDNQGKLVGINTAIIGPNRANVGIGFAIPSNMIKSIANQLIEYGTVRRGFFGIMMQSMTPELSDEFKIPGITGALVTDVIPNSPAANSGIKTKDVILGLDGKTVDNASDVHNMIGLKRPGTSVHLKVARPGNGVIDIKAKLMNREGFQRKSNTPPMIQGVQFVDFEEIIPGIGYLKGVQVIGLDDNSQAWFSGIRQGDVILTVDGRKVTNIKNFQKLFSTLNNDHVLLKVQRGLGRIYIVMTQPTEMEDNQAKT